MCAILIKFYGQQSFEKLNIRKPAVLMMSPD
jgi:hypothetical protein